MKSSAKWFALGFLTALLLFGAVIFGALRVISRDGLTVYLDPDPVADEVQSVLSKEAEEHIGSVVESVRDDLPDHVASNVAGSFESLSVSIYGVQVPLPDAVIERMEDSLNEHLAKEMENWVEEFPWESMLRDLTRTTGYRVKDMMKKHNDLWKVEMDLPGNISIPISVKFTSTD